MIEKEDVVDVIVMFIGLGLGAFIWLLVAGLFLELVKMVI